MQNCFWCTCMTSAASAQQICMETLCHQWIERGFQNTRKMWKLLMCNTFFHQKLGRFGSGCQLLAQVSFSLSGVLYVLYDTCHFPPAKKPSFFFSLSSAKTVSILRARASAKFFSVFSESIRWKQAQSLSCTKKLEVCFSGYCLSQWYSHFGNLIDIMN